MEGSEGELLADRFPDPFLNLLAQHEGELHSPRVRHAAQALELPRGDARVSVRLGDAGFAVVHESEHRRSDLFPGAIDPQRPPAPKKPLPADLQEVVDRRSK